MSTATDHTWDLFTKSAIDDGDRGYPDGVAFVSRDNDNLQMLLWKNLSNGRPTIVVDEDALEIRLDPIEQRPFFTWLDRRLGRVKVTVMWRHSGASHAYRVPSSIRRRDIARFEFDDPRLAPAGA